MESKQSEVSSIPLAEWLVAFVGLLLVCGSLAFLAYRATTEEEPPVFEAELLGVSEVSRGAYLADVRVYNRGGTAVASLRLVGQVRGELPADPKEVTVDYLPGHSSRKVGLIFPVRPAQGNLEITFESYAHP
ncbi:MAG: hypothetical protein ACO1RT_08765 [Planctomycetaceae bacterium]